MEDVESIRLDLSSMPQLQTSKLHRLPCKIHYDGYAPVEEMFPCSVATSEKDTSTTAPKPGSLPESDPESGPLVATFRGRKLLGEEVRLADSVLGIVTPKVVDCRVKEGIKTLEPTACFNAITYWNHDLEPSDRDLMKGWMEWVKVSADLHAPVE